MVYIWVLGLKAAAECIFMYGNLSPDFNESMSQHSFMAQKFNIDQVVCSWRKCNGFSCAKYAPAFTVQWPSL